jgi:hypothetical protein
LARDLEDKRHRLIARSRLGAPSTPRLLKLTVPLSSVEQEVARLMVDGLDHDETILGADVPAFWPLTLVQAARSCGYPMKKARNYLGDHPPFNALRRRIMDGRRKAEEARNLATLIKIRDDPGQGLAADRTVQIKAVAAIEGTEGKGGVTVNVSQTNNIATISPGYVVRLGKFSRPPEGLPTIGASPEVLTIDHASATERQSAS